MATQFALRWRRHAAQLHALEQVERDIRASDPHLRRKYLRDFNEAFREYESVLNPAQLQQALLTADLLLVGDYHALPASQRYFTQLLQQLTATGRPVVVALEMVLARDQHILDEWMTGEIDEQELRERIRFDLDWNLDWQPFSELMQASRRQAAGLYGLDCTPRDDLRRILARDRHAAIKIAEIRQRHPEAAILVLFGESHLAPTHLPALVKRHVPRGRVLTVLQNVDALYWHAAGERRPRVEAVRVSDDVICIFTAAPLEKYESYRLCIERWRQQRSAAIDLAPMFYNLIDALLRFLNIDKYSARLGEQRQFLLDLFPEVYCRSSEDALGRLLLRKGASEVEIRTVLEQVETSGCCYLPRINAVFARHFQLMHGAQEAARFVHHACRGLIGSGTRPVLQLLASDPARDEDRFYTRVLEEALAYFGSRQLYAARPPVRESDLYAHYAQPQEAIEEQTLHGYREYMEMIDFLVMHKDYESNHRRYYSTPELIRTGLAYTGEKFDFVTRQLGQMLGSELYDAYISGRVAKRFIRALFFRNLSRPGAPSVAYYAAARRARSPRKRLLA